MIVNGTKSNQAYSPLNTQKLKYFPFYLISLLPFRMLYALSDFSFFMLYAVFKYRRNVVEMNLRNSFPEKSPDEIKKISKRFYKHFCDITIESVKALSMVPAAISQRFRITNPELLEKYYKEQRSVILYTAHYGNWEWLAFLPLSTTYTASTFYQPLSNSYYDGLMKLIRGRFGVICIESSKGYKQLLQFKKENILTITYMVGDQRPGKKSTMYWTTFLNQQTAFLTGAEVIARKTNQVLLYPSYKKVKRGYYELTFVLLDDQPQEHPEFSVIEKYISAIEENICIIPEMWLWSHRRWKLKVPEQSAELNQQL